MRSVSRCVTCQAPADRRRGRAAPSRHGDSDVGDQDRAARARGRVAYLAKQIERLDELLRPLVAATAPELVARHGVGTDTAGALLVAAGDNPARLRSEAAFAHLCGAAPIEASSGKVIRHRLNQGGDRHANNALWRIAITRMSSDARTRDYVVKRTAQGKSKREIIRCLKRYIARELFPLLTPEKVD